MNPHTTSRSFSATVTTVSVLAMLVVWTAIIGAVLVGSLTLSEGELSAFLLGSGVVFGTIGWLLRDE